MHFRPKIFGVFTTILMELNFRGLHNEKLVIFFNSDGQQTPGTSEEIVTIFKRGNPRTDCGGGGGMRVVTDEGKTNRRIYYYIFRQFFLHAVLKRETTND